MSSALSNWGLYASELLEDSFQLLGMAGTPYNSQHLYMYIGVDPLRKIGLTLTRYHSKYLYISISGLTLHASELLEDSFQLLGMAGNLYNLISRYLNIISLFLARCRLLSLAPSIYGLRVRINLREDSFQLLGMAGAPYSSDCLYSISLFSDLSISLLSFRLPDRVQGEPETKIQIYR